MTALRCLPGSATPAARRSIRSLWAECARLDEIEIALAERVRFSPLGDIDLLNDWADAREQRRAADRVLRKAMLEADGLRHLEVVR